MGATQDRRSGPECPNTWPLPLAHGDPGPPRSSGESPCRKNIADRGCLSGRTGHAPYTATHAALSGEHFDMPQGFELSQAERPLLLLGRLWLRQNEKRRCHYALCRDEQYPRHHVLPRPDIRRINLSPVFAGIFGTSTCPPRPRLCTFSAKADLLCRYRCAFGRDDDPRTIPQIQSPILGHTWLVHIYPDTDEIWAACYSPDLWHHSGPGFDRRALDGVDLCRAQWTLGGWLRQAARDYLIGH